MTDFILCTILGACIGATCVAIAFVVGRWKK